MLNLYFRILKARDYSCKCNMLINWKDEIDEKFDSLKKFAGEGASIGMSSHLGQSRITDLGTKADVCSFPSSPTLRSGHYIGPF